VTATETDVTVTATGTDVTVTATGTDVTVTATGGKGRDIDRNQRSMNSVQSTCIFKRMEILCNKFKALQQLTDLSA